MLFNGMYLNSFVLGSLLLNGKITFTFNKRPYGIHWSFPLENFFKRGPELLRSTHFVNNFVSYRFSQNDVLLKAFNQFLLKFSQKYFKGTLTDLKNGVSKSIVHVIKHTNFQLYRVHPDGVI